MLLDDSKRKDARSLCLMDRLHEIGSGEIFPFGRERRLRVGGRQKRSAKYREYKQVKAKQHESAIDTAHDKPSKPRVIFIEALRLIKWKIKLDEAALETFGFQRTINDSHEHPDSTGYFCGHSEMPPNK